MNHKYIEAKVGKEISEQIDTSCNIEDHPIDARLLDVVIRGATIIGADPVDYPETDELQIYIKAANGAVLEVSIEGDPVGEDYPKLNINVAELLG